MNNYILVFLPSLNNASNFMLYSENIIQINKKKKKSCRKSQYFKEFIIYEVKCV